MPKKYDIVSKDLLEINPADWVAFFGQSRPRNRVRVIDSDLGTIIRIADKVIFVDDPRPWILHIEFQTSADEELSLRLLLYNALLRRRHRVPVVTVVILLRPSADHPSLTGTLHTEAPIGPNWDFPYQVIRLWKLPTETVLNGPLSLLPYAPLTGIEEPELPKIIGKIKNRIDREATPSLSEKLWTATLLLLGLQYSETIVKRLMAEVREMRESVTYQLILGEEARKIILLQGRERFGPPNEDTKTAIEAIDDVKKLERLSKKLLKAKSWNQLLGRKVERK